MSPIPRSPSRPPGHPPSTFDGQKPRTLAELRDRHAARAFAIAWAILGTTRAADGAVERASADLSRQCDRDDRAMTTGGWFCRVATHALDIRRHDPQGPGTLNDLTDVQSLIFTLTEIGRLSVTETAAATGLSPKTIRRTAARAPTHRHSSRPARSSGPSDPTIAASTADVHTLRDPDPRSLKPSHLRGR